MNTIYQNRRTIMVSSDTHAKLSAYCLKVESYDEAIQRLLREEKEKVSKKFASYESKV